MRLRRAVSVVALLGVLLHVAAVARHNVAVLDRLLQYYDLLSGYGQICHANGEAGSVAAADLPSLPKPSHNQGSCPICSGLVSAFALAGPEPIALIPPPLPAPRPAVAVEVPSRKTHTLPPPARAPPAVA